MRRWSDDAIFEAFDRWTKKHGRPPTWNDWERASDDHPSSFTVHLRCGSWSEALEMAGYKPHRSGGPQLPQKFSREEARRLRKKGLSDREIAAELGVSPKSINKALGPKPKPPRKPRNAVERREARVAALQKALAKNK